MSNTSVPQSLPHGFVLQGKRNAYIIDGPLGQGAFGITYLAKYRSVVQGEMGRGSAWIQVCVKEFFMRELSSREESTGSLHEATGNSLVSRYRKAFLREANNLARMQHSNIVNVFEVIEANNTAYIVMEYIDGGNLDDYIARKGHLSEDEALRLFQPICDAMNYMHAQRMLHLDLKPKNVMLDEEGKPYLIDFGLSKQYTQDGEPESSTSIGLGTPGYAPSEQAEQRDGDNSFRATIDVYALGGTLYKMLTGETPPKATEISEAVLDGTNLILEKLRKAGVSQQTSFIISKAMYPSSRKRYQSVTELMEALGWGQGKTNEETSYIRKESLNNSIHSTLQDEETRIIHQQSVLPKQPSTTQKPTGSQAMPSPQEWERTEKKTKRASTFLVIGLCIIILLGIIRTCEISHTPVQSKPVSTQPAKTASNASSTQQPSPQHKDQKPTKQTAQQQEQPSAQSSVLTHNGHEYVDLGLSVMWATCNVGASSPSAYGNYYAWGEITTKNDYSWATLKYCSDSKGDYFRKYVTQFTSNVVDDRKTLDLSDDVANIKWGGNWRIPTDSEWTELRENCTSIWTELNGVYGRKIIGPNGNSIFLPAAGYRFDSLLNNSGTNGHYWTSTLNEKSNNTAWNVSFHKGRMGRFAGRRCSGLSVRPVCRP